ncbi:MAG: 50S ribosomal protein L11 methyltransferase [Eubacteriales bacterium]|nr:50S ribosomal protein L11 methyltransferase [Eubacteriales bacterium]MDD4389938.1 50S ribosomal protein L11 methyltransferase [Eubacteriales bacterium]
MKYTEVKISTNKNGIELLSAGLIKIGIENLVINDPDDIADLLDKKNSYDWDYIDESVLELQTGETYLTIYLEDNEKGRASFSEILKTIDSLHKYSRESKIDLGSLEYNYKVVDDEDWKNNWKEYFKPTHITDRIVVKPTWEQYNKQLDEELVIELDPGQAFGTGTHETTSCCIRLLEKYITPGDKLLDVGSGSGILSIAGRLLGASEVLGVEIDPEAVRVGRENVEINGLSDFIEIAQGDLTEGVDLCADIAVANLMADLVKILSRDISKHIKRDGVYISSGILTELENDVSSKLIECGFEIKEIIRDGEWCAIAAINRGE